MLLLRPDAPEWAKLLFEPEPEPEAPAVPEPTPIPAPVETLPPIPAPDLTVPAPGLAAIAARDLGLRAVEGYGATLATLETEPADADKDALWAAAFQGQGAPAPEEPRQNWAHRALGWRNRTLRRYLPGVVAFAEGLAWKRPPAEAPYRVTTREGRVVGRGPALAVNPWHQFTQQVRAENRALVYGNGRGPKWWSEAALQDLDIVPEVTDILFGLARLATPGFWQQEGRRVGQMMHEMDNAELTTVDRLDVVAQRSLDTTARFFGEFWESFKGNRGVVQAAWSYAVLVAPAVRAGQAAVGAGRAVARAGHRHLVLRRLVSKGPVSPKAAAAAAKVVKSRPWVGPTDPLARVVATKNATMAALREQFPKGAPFKAGTLRADYLMADTVREIARRVGPVGAKGMFVPQGAVGFCCGLPPVAFPGMPAGIEVFLTGNKVRAMVPRGLPPAGATDVVTAVTKAFQAAGVAQLVTQGLEGVEGTVPDALRRTLSGQLAKGEPPAAAPAPGTPDSVDAAVHGALADAAAGPEASVKAAAALRDYNTQLPEPNAQVAEVARRLDDRAVTQAVSGALTETETVNVSTRLKNANAARVMGAAYEVDVPIYKAPSGIPDAPTGMTRLYHGTTARIAEQVIESGFTGGMFSTTRTDALAREVGEVLLAFDVPASQVPKGMNAIRLREGASAASAQYLHRPVAVAFQPTYALQINLDYLLRTAPKPVAPEPGPAALPAPPQRLALPPGPAAEAAVPYGAQPPQAEVGDYVQFREGGPEYYITGATKTRFKLIDTKGREQDVMRNTPLIKVGEPIPQATPPVTEPVRPLAQAPVPAALPAPPQRLALPPGPKTVVEAVKLRGRDKVREARRVIGGLRDQLRAARRVPAAQKRFLQETVAKVRELLGERDPLYRRFFTKRTVAVATPAQRQALMTRVHEALDAWELRAEQGAARDALADAVAALPTMHKPWRGLVQDIAAKFQRSQPGEPTVRRLTGTAEWLARNPAAARTLPPGLVDELDRLVKTPIGDLSAEDSRLVTDYLERVMRQEELLTKLTGLRDYRAVDALTARGAAEITASRARAVGRRHPVAAPVKWLAGQSGLNAASRARAMSGPGGAINDNVTYNMTYRDPLNTEIISDGVKVMLTDRVRAVYEAAGLPYGSLKLQRLFASPITVAGLTMTVQEAQGLYVTATDPGTFGVIMREGVTWRATRVKGQTRPGKWDAPVKLTPEALDGIADQLPPAVRKIADDVKAAVFGDQELAERLDDQFFAIKGRHLNLTEGYVPRRVNRAEEPKDLTAPMRQNIKIFEDALGVFQPRTGGLPIEIVPLDELVTSYIEAASAMASGHTAQLHKTAMYVGDPRVRRAIETRYGRDAMRDHDRHVTYMVNHGRRGTDWGVIDSLAQLTQTGATVGMVSLNVGTLGIQACSMPITLAKVGPEAFARGVAQMFAAGTGEVGPLAKRRQLMAQHPSLRWRWGGYVPMAAYMTGGIVEAGVAGARPGPLGAFVYGFEATKLMGRKLFAVTDAIGVMPGLAIPPGLPKPPGPGATLAEVLAYHSDPAAKPWLESVTGTVNTSAPTLSSVTQPAMVELSRTRPMVRGVTMFHNMLSCMVNFLHEGVAGVAKAPKSGAAWRKLLMYVTAVATSIIGVAAVRKGRRKLRRGGKEQPWDAETLAWEWLQGLAALGYGMGSVVYGLQRTITKRDLYRGAEISFPQLAFAEAWIDGVGGMGVALRGLLQDERFKSGPKRGDLKFWQDLDRAAGSLTRALSYTAGIPLSPVLDIEGAIKWATKQPPRRPAVPRGPRPAPRPTGPTGPRRFQ